MISCAFCGRDNDTASRFCIDCGKPITPSTARADSGSSPPPIGGPPPQPPHSYNVVVGAAAPHPAVSVPSAVAAPAPMAGAPATAGSIVPAAPEPVQRPRGSGTAVRQPVRAVRCPRCTKPVDVSLPFCGHCGTRVVPAGAGTCAQCGGNYLQGVDLFCARCGNRVGQRVSVEVHGARAASTVAAPANGRTQALPSTRRETQPRLALLEENGEIARSYILERGEAVIGRGDADIRFESDHYMSPLHARVEMRGGQLWLRDLGSRNGTWSFIEKPARLTDGDLVLVGSQVLRFRRLGYPGPHPPEADSTRRMGSLVPSADVAVLEQLRADGSVRDTLHLSPGRSVLLGRETGDWIFPYDQTMSSRHAEVRSEDSEFYIHDAGSRNGVAMAVRGERQLQKGQRLLLGDQIMRVERA